MTHCRRTQYENAATHLHHPTLANNNFTNSLSRIRSRLFKFPIMLIYSFAAAVSDFNVSTEVPKVSCQSCCFKPAHVFLENLRKCLDELLCLHRTHGASMALANVIKHLKFRARKLQQGLKGHHPLQSFACAAWADEMVSTDARHYKRPPAKADPAALSFRASDRCSSLSFRQVQPPYSPDLKSDRAVLQQTQNASAQGRGALSPRALRSHRKHSADPYPAECSNYFTYARYAPN